MRKLLKGILIIISILSLVSCSEKKEENLKVRVAFFPNITHTQALMGKESKFKSSLGCDIDWKKFNAGSSEIEALMAGEIDIGYIGPGPAINGFLKSNGELQIISGVCEGGSVLVSRKNLSIKTPAELEGKKIAVPQYGNTQHVVLQQILDSNGLKETSKGGTVEVVQADNPDVKTLFDKEAIDAAFVPEPWASRLIEEVEANVVLENDKTWRNGRYPVAVLIARTDFIKNHPELVEKFIKTHVELTEQAIKELPQTEVLVNEEIKNLTGANLSQKILDSSYNRLYITTDPNKEAILEMADFMKRMGIIKESGNLDKLFSLTILEKVEKSE